MKLPAMVLAGLMMCGCADTSIKTPPQYLTIGMACTINEESAYPHVWREKRNPKNVCATMEELLPFEQWNSRQQMHFKANIKGEDAAEFSSWYGAEWWIGMQPYPNEKGSK